MATLAIRTNSDSAAPALVISSIIRKKKAAMFRISRMRFFFHIRFLPAAYCGSFFSAFSASTTISG